MSSAGSIAMPPPGVIEEQLRRKGSIGPELERMMRYGSVAPDLWMINATGEPVSAGPLLRATEAALGK